MSRGDIGLRKGLDMKIKLRSYDVCKYSKDSLVYKILNYDEVKTIEVIENGPDAWEIESGMSEDEMDPLHEYLVLFFKDGDTATFRNSYVDIKIEEN